MRANSLLPSPIRQSGAWALVLGLLIPSVQGDDSKTQLEVADLTDSPIEISQGNDHIVVTWPIASDRQGWMTFDLTPGAPLIRSIDISTSDDSFTAIATNLDPVILLRVGERDLALRGGWTVFFDRMQEKPHDEFTAQINPTAARAEAKGSRATLTIDGVTAGPFTGSLRYTFYAGEAFVLQEAVVSTQQDSRAYLYDAGFVFRNAVPQRMAWHDASGSTKNEEVDALKPARPLAVHGRSIAADFESGSLAVFPPPHRYFYPLDFSDNLKNIWTGKGYREASLPFGFGIRHDPRGDNRFVPWFNAPPGTQQELGLFLLVSDKPAEQSLKDVARLTRNDRFAPLEGYTTFASHFHVEHTQELLEQQDDEERRTDLEGRLPSGGKYRIPERLQNPGFVRSLRGHGVDIVHLAEFHFGETPRWNTEQRLQWLELLHAECDRLSDEKFLLLPGEEPNVYFGGHWISFFPKPVNWVLNRPEGTPFVTEHPQLGKVYHVGSEADVFQLLRAENGLAWTAHPRIKGSTGFPDGYRDRLFFQSEQFLGGAWKAMPADLSQPRLGSRVLDLLDDMSNWGEPKYVLGEVDVFKIEPEHELYAHMNVNYLRLESIPTFSDGWEPVLATLRKGAFFVTTGEVLIPEFTVNGRRSGERLSLDDEEPATIELDLQWTFPLAYAEVISGDGQTTKRQKVDLSSTTSFGKERITIPVDVSGQKWVRVEVWDIATNGAFTQPVWIE